MFGKSLVKSDGARGLDWDVMMRGVLGKMMVQS